MTDRKVSLHINAVVEFLQKEFSKQIVHITPIIDGERSETYSFSSEAKDYIIRINREIEGFEKDKNAYEDFHTLFPVPKIIKMGRYDDHFYAISEKAKGAALNNANTLSPELQNEIFTILDTLHATPVYANAKYGLIDAKRTAHYNSWEEYIFKPYLLVVKKDGSFLTWEEIYTLPLTNKDEMEELRKRIKKLLAFIPKEKSIVHGDFGGNNLIADGDHITGVIDWSESMYGDFLYDIAYYGFWSGRELIDKYKEHCDSLKRDIPFFEERIKCHQLLLGLNGLAIYAYINLPDEYRDVEKRIQSI